MGCEMCAATRLGYLRLAGPKTKWEESSRQGIDSRPESTACQPAPCQLSGASVCSLRRSGTPRRPSQGRRPSKPSQRGSAGRRPWAHLMVWWNTQPSPNQGVWSRSHSQRQVPGNAKGETKMTRSLAQRVPAYWRTQLQWKPLSDLGYDDMFKSIGGGKQFSASSPLNAPPNTVRRIPT